MIPSEYASTAPTSEKSLRSRTETTMRPPSRICARSSARASSFSFANSTDSYTCWNTACTSAPASTSSAASLSAFGVVFVYWKRPVSVTSAMYSGSAISGVISTPSSRKTSRRTSPVDDASATMRFTSPKRELSWWWSTSSLSFASMSRPGSGLMRSAFAQSTATSTRSATSSGTCRVTSSSGMNAYSRGSGESPLRYMTASLPSWRRARAVASSDPSESPSGFSWLTTRKRSFARRASATALRSLVGWGELIDEVGHAHAALDRGIVLERQLRSPLHPELAREAALQQPVRRGEALERRLPLPRRAEDAHVHGRMVEVGRRHDACDGDEADARVLQFRERLPEDPADRLVHSPHALGPDRIQAGLSPRGRRRSARRARPPIPGRAATARPRRAAAPPRRARARCKRR